MLTILSAYDMIVYTLGMLEAIKMLDSRMELIELRKSTGMNRKDFANYFEIPYRTMQEWELGNRKMPTYLLRLMSYKVKVEKLDCSE